MKNGQQMRFTPEELNVLQATFHDNHALIAILRKLFLPEIDPNAPVGQIIDVWMSIASSPDVDAETIKTAVIARNMLINHIEAQLMQITALSQKVKSPDEIVESMKKDSTK